MCSHKSAKGVMGGWGGEGRKSCFMRLLASALIDPVRNTITRSGESASLRTLRRWSRSWFQTMLHSSLDSL